MKTKITAVIICLVATLYVIFGFFIAPKLIAHYATKIAIEKDLNLTIKDIKINPFTFEANITGVEVLQKLPIIRFDAIYVDFEPSNLFDKTINIKTLKLQNPQVFVQKDENNTFNFSFLLQNDLNQTSKSEPQSDKLNFEYKIKNLEITNAMFDYIDLKSGFKLNLQNMNYKLSNLSTKDKKLGFHSLLADSNLANHIIIDANASFNPVKIDGILEIKELDINPIWVSFLQDMPLSVRSATLSSKIDYKLVFDENLSIKADVNTLIKDLNISQNTNKFALSSFYVPHFSLELENSSEDFNIKVQAKEIIASKFKTKFEEFDAKLGDINLTNQTITYSQKFGTNLNLDLLKLGNFNATKQGLNLDISKLNLNKFELKNELISTKNISILEANSHLDEKNYLELKSFIIDDLNFLDNNLSIKNISVQKPNFASFIDDKGSKFINSFLNLIPKSSNKTSKNSKEFDYNIQNFTLKNGSLNLSDPFSQNKLKNIEITAKNIQNKDKFELNLDIKDQILDLKSSNSIDTSKSKFNSDLKLKLHNLHFIKPYLKEHINAQNLNANLSLNAKTSFDKFIKTKADLAINNFSINDEKNELLGSFKSLTGHINFQENNLFISNIKLENPNLKLAISKQKELNILNLIKTKDAKQTSNDNQALNINLKNINIKNGSLEFKDESLPIVFDTNITKISTTINEISNNKTSNIALHGVVANYGFSEILVTTMPFNPTSNTDLILRFKNINLKNITPYSVKFLGYEIDDGRLNVNLNYKIKNSILNASNSLNFDNLTLGREIPSKDAVSLPLKLAISILRDSNNQIDINLPINGDLNSPEFSYASIVWKAIFQLFSDIVTSPFRFIGNALNISVDELSSIDFAPGSAFLLETSENKIKKLADIAQKKPDIVFTLSPTYSTKTDTYAIASRAVQREIALAMNTKDLNYENATQMLFRQKINNENFVNADVAIEKLINLTKVSENKILNIAAKRVENLRKRLLESGVDESQIEVLDITDANGAKKDKKVSMKINIKTK
ncbi:hypothetical protein CHL9752_08485 [Campylobacter hyointestinalis subsp. lawsonii]|uniref:DUF748 domain-containing protein n=1 Tax=Campylobacter hyointestinalis TaxID=198 RepID=UPI000DCE7115|nr:DUF748 domain-containing protein [Campylobacter hyointestinalis]RAZ22845.1 hypothetical protein CHL9752_08485 [Campylobacter hyointestinalis subsp. lawsonii]